MKDPLHASFEKEEQIAALIAASLKGTLTLEQRKALDAWLQESPKNKVHFKQAYCSVNLQYKLKTYYAANKESVWAQTQAKIDAAESKPVSAGNEAWVAAGNSRSMGRLWWAAAVVFLSLSIGGFFYLRQQSNNQPSKASAYQRDLPPGGNRATLTLADGRTISLVDTIQGIIASVDGIQIHKTADGQLVYNIQGNSNRSQAQPNFNTITTPQGGQYQIILPDGTHVWLNAASSLRYPTQFAGEERTVELQGEGYFEVAVNKQQPFKVISRGQEVQVLGTHFNINAYDDEPSIRTTLVEGSVQITSARNPSHRHLLKPGQQSVVTDDGGVSIQTVDVEPVIAWHKGFFMFRDRSLDELVRELARWYDFTYIGDPLLDNGLYTLYMSRRSTLSKIMRMLEAAGGVMFEIDEKNRRVISKPITIDKQYKNELK